MSSISLKPIHPDDVAIPASGFKTTFLNLADNNLLYYKDEYGNLTRITNLSNDLYIHTQGVASTSWIINHNLNTFPSAVVIDSAGTRVHGDETYIDANTMQLDFSVPFGGKAYLTFNRQ